MRMRKLSRMTKNEIQQEYEKMKALQRGDIEDDMAVSWHDLSALRHEIETSNFNAIDGSNVMRALQHQLKNYHNPNRVRKARKQFNFMGGVQRFKDLERYLGDI